MANPFKEHALLNCLVIQKIFQYLEPSASFHTLKNIRLVCRLWRDESLSLWRKTAVLKLISDQQLNLVETSSFQVSTFSQVFQRMQDPLQFYRLGEKPFQNYKLEYVNIHSLCSSDQKSETSVSNTNQFWHYIGPNVKQLLLNCVGFIGEPPKLDPGPEYEYQFLCFLTKYIPHIESLTVKTTRVPGIPRWNNSFSQMLSQIQLTNLRSLNCENFSYFSFANFPNLQNASVPCTDSFIKMIQYQPRGESLFVYPTLKTLNLALWHDSVNFYHIREPFRRVRFPALEELRLAYRSNNISTNTIDFLSLLLQNNSKQLKYLEVFIPPFVKSYAHFNFHCQFDQLTELRVYGDVLSDLSILGWTPKLKKLHIDLFCLERLEEVPKFDNERGSRRLVLQDMVEAFAKSGINLKRVVAENLEYLQINNKLSKNILKVLGECMPNLKTLKTVLRPEVIPVICNVWPMLEHLEGTHGSTLTDSEVTGFVVWDIEKKKCLKDLKQLRRFHLKSYCNEGTLTDATVLDGFLKMEKLTDLQVCVSPEFSNEAEALMKDKIFNVNVIRNYNGNQDHQNWECCQIYQYMMRRLSLNAFRSEILPDTELAKATLSELIARLL